MDAAEPWPFWSEGDAEPSGIIDDYDIGALIYNGPFSLVFHGTGVRGPHEGKHLALKFLKHRDTAKIDRELRILKTLRHPNIVPMLGDFRYRTFHCIVFPYAECGTLEDYGFRRRERLSVRDAHWVLFQVLNALSYVHRMGFVHGDVKPPNVLVHGRDEVKVWVCDFGLTKSVEEDQKLTGILGTDLYQAPELFVRKGFSEKVDIWGVGVVLYRMMTGVAPFISRSDINPRRMGMIFREPAWRVKVDGVKGLLEKLLSIDAGKRLSANEALKDRWVSSLMDWKEDFAEDPRKSVVMSAETARELSERAH
jgi:serine/threonine protein kinase